MDTLVSDAVHNFLSSAPLHLRFPSLTDRTWDTTFACTERELDTKRSLGSLALYSYLELALTRIAEQLDNPPVSMLHALQKNIHDHFFRTSNHYAKSYFLTMF